MTFIPFLIINNDQNIEYPRGARRGAARSRLGFSRVRCNPLKFQPFPEPPIRKWEEFCKPAGFVDDMGIMRLRYAHAGWTSAATDPSRRCNGTAWA
jgi:hypothetical protein